MAKKFTGIRLDDETINFLSREALKNDIHHKLSPEIPNITGIIEEIITIYKKLNEKGITLACLKRENFIESISKMNNTQS